MPEAVANGARLHYHEQGEGAPIACIHGTGGSGVMWADAVAKLARLGRAIAYDRRGCGRSERPEPFERVTVSEHADDVAALLDSLEAAPAVVIGRSYGGAVAIDLALRYPDRVRALVLLEPADIRLSPAAIEAADALTERIRRAAAQGGVDAAGQALIDAVLGPDAWDSFPDEVRRIFTQNGPAILAEAEGGGLDVDAAALGAIEHPALVIAATDSPPEFRELSEAIAEALPNARTALVGGGHLIDPAAPEVMEFIGELLGSRH